MEKALKRVNELQQEMIDKSKKIPDSESIVKAKLSDFNKVVKYSEYLKT
jgi:hypothetical protein